MPRWDQLEESAKDEIVALYATGLSCVAIGKKFDRCGETVKRVLRQKGIKLRRHMEYRNGKRTGQPLTQEQRDKNRIALKGHHNRYREKYPERHILYYLKLRARRKGVPFNLEETDIVFPDFCPVLGIKLDRNIGRYGPKDSSPTVDRIKPELGYVKGNIRVISDKANRIKNNASIEEVELVLADMRSIARGELCP